MLMDGYVPEAVRQNVQSLALGSTHAVALLESSRLFAWGDNARGQLNVPEGES